MQVLRVLGQRGHTHRDPTEPRVLDLLPLSTLAELAEDCGLPDLTLGSPRSPDLALESGPSTSRTAGAAGRRDHEQDAGRADARGGLDRRDGGGPGVGASAAGAAPSVPATVERGGGGGAWADAPAAVVRAELVARLSALSAGRGVAAAVEEGRWAAAAAARAVGWPGVASSGGEDGRARGRGRPAEGGGGAAGAGAAWVGQGVEQQVQVGSSAVGGAPGAAFTGDGLGQDLHIWQDQDLEPDLDLDAMAQGDPRRQELLRADRRRQRLLERVVDVDQVRRGGAQCGMM